MRGRNEESRVRHGRRRRREPAAAIRRAQLEDPPEQVAVVRDLCPGDRGQLLGEVPERVVVTGGRSPEGDRAGQLGQEEEVLLDEEAEPFGRERPAGQLPQERVVVQRLPELAALTAKRLAKRHG